MPNILKAIEKCKHPNSRKTKSLAKKIKQKNNRDKTKMGHAIKSNMFGDILIWFTEKTQENTEALKPDEFQMLIEEYLNRFDAELKQIKMKHEIHKNRAKQHLNRENVIRMTREREHNEFKTCGLEMIDLCNSETFKSFKNWDGNAVNIQHLKFVRISKKYLEDLRKSNHMDVN